MTDIDFRKDLSVADIRIGPTQHLRVYAFTADDMLVPLVELRFTYWDNLHLTVEQAEAISPDFVRAMVQHNYPEAYGQRFAPAGWRRS